MVSPARRPPAPDLRHGNLRHGNLRHGNLRHGDLAGLPGQIGGTDDACVLTELRGPDLRERPVTPAGQGPFEGRAGRVEQQFTRLGHATADHEAGRIEHRGQVGQALAEPAADDLEAAQRDRVAFGRGLSDLRTGNTLGYSPAQLKQPHGALRGPPGELTRLGDQGVAADVLLPAAPVPAAAEPTVGDHPDVPGLARNAPAAAVQLAADKDGGPDPGPDRHQHHVAVAAGGTEPRLGPGRGVRVVLHHDRAAEPLLHSLLERLVAPGQVRREQHGGARAVDEAGGAEADGGDLVAVQQFGHHIGDRLFGQRRAGGRGRPLQLRDDAAVLVHHPGRDLGTTDINADGQGQGADSGVSGGS